MAKMLVKYAQEGELWEYGHGFAGDEPTGPNRAGWYFILDEPDEDMADWWGPFDTEDECRKASETHAGEYDRSWQCPQES